MKYFAIMALVVCGLFELFLRGIVFLVIGVTVFPALVLVECQFDFDELMRPVCFGFVRDIVRGK